MRVWFVFVCLCLSACAPRVTAPPPGAPPTVPVTTGAVAASGSAGCGKTAPATPPSSLNVGGRARDFITALPADYDPDRPHALVVAFHGRTNSSAQARTYFGLESAMPDTLFVYPSGLRQGRGYSWADPGDPEGALRDYAFFDAIVQTMSGLYCLAPSRVFVVGHSLGAYFANSVACARAGVVRAVASLAGGPGGSQCRGPVAAMIMHNPNDRHVAVAQGAAARDVFRAADHATAPAMPVTDPLLRAFRCVQYGAAPDAALYPVLFYPVLWCPHPFDTRHDGSYYPHTWPPRTAEAVAMFFGALP